MRTWKHEKTLWQRALSGSVVNILGQLSENWPTPSNPLEHKLYILTYAKKFYVHYKYTCMPEFYYFQSPLQKRMLLIICPYILAFVFDEKNMTPWGTVLWPMHPEGMMLIALSSPIACQGIVPGQSCGTWISIHMYQQCYSFVEHNATVWCHFKLHV